MEGVEQVAWAMKGVLLPLQGKIVEIGIDATCERSRHLELYTILGEYDNAGFPQSIGDLGSCLAPQIQYCAEICPH